MASDMRANQNHASRDNAGARRRSGFAFRVAAMFASAALMRLLFYVVVTPIGIAMRMTGWDPLRRRRDPSALSYWIERRPPGRPAVTMRRQF